MSDRARSYTRSKLCLFGSAAARSYLPPAMIEAERC